MRDPIWDGTDQDLWIVSGSFGNYLQECTQAGCVIASHVSLPLLSSENSAKASEFRQDRTSNFAEVLAGDYFLDPVVENHINQVNEEYNQINLYVGQVLGYVIAKTTNNSNNKQIETCFLPKALNAHGIRTPVTRVLQPCCQVIWVPSYHWVVRTARFACGALVVG